VRDRGTVYSFDEVQGIGTITPEAGGEPVNFERGPDEWSPEPGEFVFFQLGAGRNGGACALDLEID
jgi:cold shock CspA family protein